MPEIHTYPLFMLVIFVRLSFAVWPNAHRYWLAPFFCFGKTHRQQNHFHFAGRERRTNGLVSARLQHQTVSQNLKSNPQTEQNSDLAAMLTVEGVSFCNTGIFRGVGRFALRR